MIKIRLNLVDSFSGCTDSRERTVTEKQLAKIEQLAINQVVCSEFSKKDQIRYDWIIEEIEDFGQI